MLTLASPFKMWSRSVGVIIPVFESGDMSSSLIGTFFSNENERTESTIQKFHHNMSASRSNTVMQ